MRALTSLGIVVLAAFVWQFTEDLFHNQPVGMNWDEATEYSSNRSLDRLIGLSLFAVPMACWHGFDMMSPARKLNGCARLFESYKLPLAPLIFGLVGGAVIVSGITERLQCWPAEAQPMSGETQYGYWCDPTAGYGSVPLVVVPALILAAIVVVKAVTVAGSLVRKYA